MPGLDDLTGRIFGRLTVVGRDERKLGRSKLTRWIVRCECGVEKSVFSAGLKRGMVRSCGCLSDEVKRTGPPRFITHGKSRTSIYSIWQSMKNRCADPANDSFEHYGARGISVHGSWLDFATFYRDVGDRPSLDYSLDRIDNDKNYEPGNVKWSTREAQGRNSRRNVLVEYQGRTMALVELIETTGISKSLAYSYSQKGRLADLVAGAIVVRTSCLGVKRDT